MLNGNEALALGAISAGLKFCSFYPMTPATSVPLTLQAAADAMGLVVEQAEDEIAAIDMAIGASYARVPAMVATSGGGFALMVEGVSLAGMTETPVFIVVGQRPGPATGLPTRTEQEIWNLCSMPGMANFLGLSLLRARLKMLSSGPQSSVFGRKISNSHIPAYRPVSRRHVSGGQCRLRSIRWMRWRQAVLRKKLPLLTIVIP